VQAEMSLRLDRMLAPVRVAPAILGQCTRVDADLLGDEGNHRCRRRLIRKDRPTGCASRSAAILYGKEAVSGPIPA
jgi:hypothetical protein